MTETGPQAEQLSEPRSLPVAPGSAELAELIRRIDEHVLDRDRDHKHPYPEFELVREARLGALRIPVTQGGAGASMRQLFETVIALAAADPDLAHSLRNHFVFIEGRLSLGDAADKWVVSATNGAIIGSAASEPAVPDVGKVQQQYLSQLNPVPGGYLLNGTKIYSTGNLYADYLVVTVQHPDGHPVQVVVPAHREGVILDDDWDGIGQRLTGSGTTRFDSVRVQPGELLSGGGPWPDDGRYRATVPQLWLTAVIAGILRRVTRDAVALVHGRERTYYHAASERPANDPLLQETVGYIASSAFAAEASVLAAADLLDAATATRTGVTDPRLSLQAALAAAKAKVVVDEIAQRAASIVFDVGGATAARQRSQLDRHWRNIRTLASHNPRPYKAKWIGDYELNGTPLPTGAFF